MDPISVLQNRIAQLEAKLGNQASSGEKQAGDHTVSENLLAAANQMRNVTANHPKLTEAGYRATELNNYSDPNFVDGMQQKEVKMHEIESAEPMVVRHCHCMHHCKKGMHGQQQNVQQMPPHIPQPPKPTSISEVQLAQQPTYQTNISGQQRVILPAYGQQHVVQNMTLPHVQEQIQQQTGHVMTSEQLQRVNEMGNVNVEQIQAHAAELQSQAGEFANEVQEAVEHVGEAAANASNALANMGEKVETAEQRRARRNGLD